MSLSTAISLASRLTRQEEVLAIANALVFFVLSLAISTFEFNSRVLVLIPPGIYGCLAFIVFCRMMYGGRILDPLVWYLLGTAIFFGIGVLVGGAQYEATYAKILFGNSIQFIINANLINSTSILIVLCTGFLVSNLRFKLLEGNQKTHFDESDIKSIIQILIALGIIDILFKIVCFPNAESLLVRSLIDKLNYVIPLISMGYGWIYKKLTRSEVVSLSMIIGCEIIIGILLFNKFAAMTPILCVILGSWFRGRSYKTIFISMMVLLTAFVVLNPLASIGRLHHQYHPQSNTLIDRLEILGDVLSAGLINKEKQLNPEGTKNSEVNAQAPFSMQGRVAGILTRLDVSFVQGFLINEYQNGRPGSTLDNFWVALIPRFLWNEKPIITGQGNDLSVLLFNNPDQKSSSTAPTYSGEAYWNGGFICLIWISIYMGLMIGVLSRLSESASVVKSPNFLAYLFIAYPAIFMSMFVESWVVPTYVGGFFTIYIVYISLIAINWVWISTKKYCLEKV